MSKKVRMPSYRLHKQSGQAVVTLPDGFSNRRDVLLGKHGTAESRAEYSRVVGEWLAGGRRLAQAPAVKDLTITELIAAFWTYAEGHYSAAGRELEMFRQSLRPLKSLYGHTPAHDFGPKGLRAVRQAMVDGSWMTPAEKRKAEKKGWRIGWCRNVVNRRVVRLRTMFRWGESEELVPKGTYHALQTVSGLRSNAQEVRHTKPVRPASWEELQAILPKASPTIGAMLLLQWYSGMRSCEVRSMRTCDLDRSNPSCWNYRPLAHKNEWRGQERVIPLGPKCIDILKPFLRADQETPLFEAKPRKQRRGRGSKPYTSFSYAQAARRAAARAGVDGFHPYMLRHACKMRIEREAGADAARTVLGHKSIQTTTHYGRLDLGKASEVMEKLG